MKKFYSGYVVKLHGKEAIVQCADNYTKGLRKLGVLTPR